MLAKLQLRVQTGLSNPDEFTDKPELFTYAVEETNGIVGSKDLAVAFVIDIAYYRFLLLADAGATEQDENNYKMALSALKSAKYLTTDETTGESVTAPRVMVKTRKSEY
jgi:hypothetical protein